MQAASDAMPTLEQVEHEVLAAEGELAAAKAKKDYRRAAELGMKLPSMHDRHSAVASAIRKAMNRKQLAEEVQRLEGEVLVCTCMYLYIGTPFIYLFIASPVFCLFLFAHGGGVDYKATRVYLFSSQCFVCFCFAHHGLDGRERTPRTN